MGVGRRKFGGFRFSFASASRMDSISSVIVTGIGCPSFCFLPEERGCLHEVQADSLTGGKGLWSLETGDHLTSIEVMEDFLSTQIQSIHRRSCRGKQQSQVKKRDKETKMTRNLSPVL